jgi:hypothetical protein
VLGKSSRDGRERSPLVQEAPFDQLAKGVATGDLSRRRALRLAAGALLGATGIASLAAPAAATHRRRGCRDKPAISNRRCPPGTLCHDTVGGECHCARTTEGDKRCVDFTEKLCPRRDECDRSRDCRDDEVCVEVGACCINPRRNVCAPRCA